MDGVRQLTEAHGFESVKLHLNCESFEYWSSIFTLDLSQC
jgi:hypothetical protein